MNSYNIKTSIEVNGRPIRTIQHEGKTFIESREDTVYSIRVKNKTWNRIKLIIGVDSLNIIDGSNVTDNPNEVGYVLNGYEEQVFRGYRLDDNSIAQFKFVKKDKSYAKENGVGKNSGVIIVRAFSEKVETIPVSYQTWITKSAPLQLDDCYFNICNNEIKNLNNDGPFTIGSNYISCSSSETVRGRSSTSKADNKKLQSFDMGSSWGKQIKESVTEVKFKVGNFLEESIFYYASIKGLESLGVPVVKEKSISFPEPYSKKYAKPPRGWNG